MSRVCPRSQESDPQAEGPSKPAWCLWESRWTTPAPAFLLYRPKALAYQDYKVSSTVKILILELAFKEMTGSVIHSNSFGITVQSLWGLEMGPPEDRMEKDLRFKVSSDNWDSCFRTIHIWLSGSLRKVLNPGGFRKPLMTRPQTSDFRISAGGPWESVF